MAVFLLAAASAALQVLASRALSVSLFDAWLALLASSAAAQAGFGLGAAAEGRLSRTPPRRWWLGLGACVLLFAVLALGLKPGQPPSLRLLAACSAVLPLFACAGAAFAAAFSGSRARRGAARTAAASLAGLGLGLWLGGRLALAPGVHAALGGLGLAFVAAGLGARPFWAAVLAAAASAWPGLDTALERRRAAPVDCNWRCNAEHLRKRYTPYLTTWTPYSRLDVMRHVGLHDLIGAYNYRVHWRWADPGPRPWSAFVRPGDRALIVGSSAGYDYRLLPPGTRLKDVSFVEIDPVVARLFLSTPSLNGGLYEDGRLIVADGRHVLDRDGPPWDALVLGSAESPSRGVARLVETRNSLMTREGVERALERLSDEGVAVYFPREREVAGAVTASLEELGRPWFLYYQSYVSSRYTVIASTPARRFIHLHDDPVTQYNVFTARGEATLARAYRAVAAADLAVRRSTTTAAIPEPDLREQVASTTRRAVLFDRRGALATVWPGGLAPPPRDASPFLAGQDLSLRPWLRAGGAAAWVLVALLAAACARRPGVASCFTALGAAYALAVTALAAVWASALGDPLRTAMVVTGLWTGGAAAGSLAVDARGPLSWRGLLAAAAGLAAGLALAAGAAPRGWDTLPALLLAAALVAPAGAAAGLFFPSALERLSPADTPRALAWDAAGAALALPLFAAFSLDPAQGFPAALAAAGALYAGAAWASRRL